MLALALSCAGGCEHDALVGRPAQLLPCYFHAACVLLLEAAGNAANIRLPRRHADDDRAVREAAVEGVRGGCLASSPELVDAILRGLGKDVEVRACHVMLRRCVPGPARASPRLQRCRCRTCAHGACCSLCMRAGTLACWDVGL